mgnify:CR=1 FL=1|tara:strand:+ start:399 stop:563 length:165 start_codon:yes stop_codon:yes gene_type:complete
MKKVLSIIFIFLSSCSQNNDLRSDFTPSDNMSFEEFSFKLDEYAKNNPYPNIDD